MKNKIKTTVSPQPILASVAVSEGIPVLIWGLELVKQEAKVHMALFVT